MEAPLKHFTTDDGSLSIYNSRLKEAYHSTHGAISESKHIFIEAGLDLFQASKKPIHILEIGFGTGLNALLSAIWADQYQIEIYYEGIEAHPLSVELIEKLNYAELLDYNKNSFLQMHGVEEERINISAYFSLVLKHQKVQKIKWPSNYFDVVFFDAFSPSVQPEMWSQEIFKAIYDAMSDGGVLTTYSTKGDVKRSLKHLGFQIEKIQGPKGKREMLRAFK